MLVALWKWDSGASGVVEMEKLVIVALWMCETGASSVVEVGIKASQKWPFLISQANQENIIPFSVSHVIIKCNKYLQRDHRIWRGAACLI